MEIRVRKRELHTSLERKCADCPVAESVSEAGSWREANAFVGSRRETPASNATVTRVGVCCGWGSREATAAWSSRGDLGRRNESIII